MLSVKILSEPEHKEILASAKERHFVCYEIKLEENKKASSQQELNPGLLAS